MLYELVVFAMTLHAESPASNFSQRTMVPVSLDKFMVIGFTSSGQEVMAMLSVGVIAGIILSMEPTKVPPEIGGAVSTIFCVCDVVFPLPSLYVQVTTVVPCVVIGNGVEVAPLMIPLQASVAVGSVKVSI